MPTIDLHTVRGQKSVLTPGISVFISLLPTMRVKTLLVVRNYTRRHKEKVTLTEHSLHLRRVRTKLLARFSVKL